MAVSDSAQLRAQLSRGISGGAAFYRFATRGLERELPASRVLDLGCGAGLLGAFLEEHYALRPLGVDLVRHGQLAEVHYESIQLLDLDRLEAGRLAGNWDFIFAIGLLEYLTNPRQFLRTAAGLLRPGGRLILTAPNPASLRSLFALLRSGQFSAFKEESNPASITPVLPVDAVRMCREAGLDNPTTDYSHRGRLIGARWSWQRLFPAAQGRWFSDDFRVIATAPGQPARNP